MTDDKKTNVHMVGLIISLSHAAMYQMGKVGSTTVTEALRASIDPRRVLQVHFLSDRLSSMVRTHRRAGVRPLPYHLYLGRATREILRRRSQWPCLVVSMVRDPIARMVSDLF